MSLSKELINTINEIYIYERRSHPEINTVRDDLSVLNSYYEREKNSESEISRYYFSFQDVDKVGVNFYATYETTPAGVYAYPLKYLYKDFISGSIPYAINRPNLFLLELTTDKYIKDDTYNKNPQLSKIGIDKLEKFCQDKGIDFSKVKELKDKYEGKLNPKGFDGNNPYAYSFFISSLLKGRGKSAINLWTKILHNVLGYDAIIDNGSGFIHRNEPTQVCFLVPSAYKIVKKLRNNLDEYPRNKDTFKKEDYKNIELKGTSYNGNLIIKNNSILSFPKVEKFTVNGNVEISGNNVYIKNWPDELEVQGDFKIFHAPNIKKLPYALDVSGYVELYSVGLTGKLAEFFYSGKNTILDDIPNLKELPSDFTVDGSLDISSVRRGKIDLSIFKNMGLFGVYGKVKVHYKSDAELLQKEFPDIKFEGYF